MEHSFRRRLTRDDYTVACICPMGVELLPVEAILDEMHQSLPTSRDLNSYTLGRMGAHNIVIALMSEIGNNKAAAVATQLQNDFRRIRFGLLVGIGGGIPSGKDDIRLGDVVVSNPTEAFGGVVQFDRGKAHPDGRFERTGTLGKTPTMLTATVQRLRVQQKREGSKIPEYLSDMLKRFPKMEEEYAYPGMEHDELFEAGYRHEGMETCQQCDRSKLIKRASRKDTIPRIHCGTIGSGNEVVKDGVIRDKLRTDLGILCVEMEAAGLMDDFPCLVIRGICDYADSHKNKRWQPYAAATAAAYARELLSVVPAQDMASTTGAADVFQNIPLLRAAQAPFYSSGDPYKQHDRSTTEAADVFQKIPLPYAAQAPFYSSENSDKQHDRICLPDTRVGVLNEITKWSNKVDETRIFWLNGMAGTGKSTIARTISQRFHEQGRLGASFFFSRGTDDRSHASKFLTTIAMQLANLSSTLRKHVCKAVAERSDIADRSQHDQWKYLVLQPLSMLEVNPYQPPIVLVIDALDECDSDKDIRGILQLFAEANSHQLRIFVTSRPEIPIRLGFRNMAGILHQDLALHQISRAVINNDISIFFKIKLEEIRKASDILPVNWPGKETIDLLVLKANGLFIYAATVCRFVEESGEQWPPDDLLYLFLPDENMDSLDRDTIMTPDESPTKELDRMYAQILEHSLRGVHNLKDRQSLASILRKVAGAVVVLFNPLSAIAIVRLLDMDKRRVQMRLNHLHSVLEVPEVQGQPLRLLHPSFRDFLLDKGRCSDQLFWVDERKAHSSLAENCLRLMTTALKRDICDIHEPVTLTSNVDSSRIEQHLPSELQYACQYWVQHLQRGETQLLDNGEVHDFLRDRLLHWLEALSLMGKVSEGVCAIVSLESMVIAEKSPHLDAFIHDVKLFVFHNRKVIEDAPLQIYHSCLVFAPETSIVRRQFKDQIPHWIRRLPKVQKVWGSLLHSIYGFGINAITFSPDGKSVLCASDDGKVRLSDSATGSSQTLEGHSDWVVDVAFSPDGRLIASASRDRTVRLWDAATGSSQTFEGHLDKVKTIAFSPDGKLVASASSDCTVRLWDTATGSSQTLEGHLNWVVDVAFSPDGKLLASASYDWTVRLWNTATGCLIQILEGHSARINAITFSLDGKLLASASGDKTVRLWDVATGSMLRKLEGHSGRATAVAFPPDGKMVASASSDDTVRLWDTTTSSQPTFEGHSDRVNIIVFSPDGTLVVSGSKDGTIKLWNPATGSSLQTLEAHSDEVNSVIFSPDGKSIVSASSDWTVRLWNSATGSLLQTLEGHSHQVNAVAISSDGKLVASASSDLTVRLWDVATGTSLQTFKGHGLPLYQVALSRDGKVVVSGSDDRTIKLWDAPTGSLLQTLDKDKSDTFLSHSDGSWYPDRGLLDTGYFLPSDIHPKPKHYLGVRGYWITLEEKNILYLPPEYRAYKAAARGNIIFLGDSSGHITSFEFDLAHSPLNKRS
ncbi:hypothetical protein GP486_004538 [Trichoglossum hirsutum]|uniref:Uncharacterized protein n=1 Tax=Trichoglossum hirsutum TaxID=265104 RepID=A0A9P8LAZ4_9PEZI|nr:hypothetical protein GP486_004538 [Trichoglossum hirsutum]